MVVFLFASSELEEGFGHTRHLTCHLVQLEDFLGNPTRWANWMDETLNRLFKAACRTTSQATFEVQVLLRMKELLPKYGLKRSL